MVKSETNESMIQCISNLLNKWVYPRPMSNDGIQTESKICNGRFFYIILITHSDARMSGNHIKLSNSMMLERRKIHGSFRLVFFFKND